MVQGKSILSGKELQQVLEAAAYILPPVGKEEAIKAGIWLVFPF